MSSKKQKTAADMTLQEFKEQLRAINEKALKVTSLMDKSKGNRTIDG